MHFVEQQLNVAKMSSFSEILIDMWHFLIVTGFFASQEIFGLHIFALFGRPEFSSQHDTITQWQNFYHRRDMIDSINETK